MSSPSSNTSRRSRQGHAPGPNGHHAPSEEPAIQTPEHGQSNHVHATQAVDAQHSSPPGPLLLSTTSHRSTRNFYISPGSSSSSSSSGQYVVGSMDLDSPPGSSRASSRQVSPRYNFYRDMASAQVAPVLSTPHGTGHITCGACGRTINAADQLAHQSACTRNQTTNNQLNANVQGTAYQLGWAVAAGHGQAGPSSSSAHGSVIPSSSFSSSTDSQVGHGIPLSAQPGHGGAGPSRSTQIRRSPPLSHIRSWREADDSAPGSG
ncbi:hypothetical protein BV25DRAFT_1261231 [Artomyces pyxidatus]|uniref:Uncharacterized protein n=1 Tax=Artomyces pyxidatus TaxID=48021 RepID=A0ACB8TER4_9AGAM|nr:hypothetical protein BV25DRAFT_1261231 [Artomyces pyxidatus]